MKYKKLVEQLVKLFESVCFEKIDRFDIEAADQLAKVASSIGDNWNKAVYVQTIPRSSMTLPRDIQCIEGVSRLDYSLFSWMDPIKAYLRSDDLSEDYNEAVKVSKKACDYAFDGEDLYRVGCG